MAKKTEFVRTPDERFQNLIGYPFAPYYTEVDGLRMHYVDEGDRHAPPVLMLHGEPTWSYLYRRIIPLVAGTGFRALAPDLIGFGKSDKPVHREDYTYQRHVDWIKLFIKQLDLKQIILVCHDWGGLIGLRIAGEQPDLFAGIVASNTFLPTGDTPAGDAFMRWRTFSQTAPEFNIGDIVKRGCLNSLTPEVIDAYNAPFPDDTYKAGARQFPALVPVSQDDPATVPNRKAWEGLFAWKKPFLTAFSDSDPITKHADTFLQQAIPGTQGQPHTTIRHGAHFLQEDNPSDLGSAIIGFLKSVPRTRD